MNDPKKRPLRIQIANQFGQRQSLDDAREQFLPMSGGNGLLLLGLGPDPAALAAATKDQSPVAYLEAPDFSRQMLASWFQGIPGHWQAISRADLEKPELLRRKALFYRPNLRLFPDFWAPVLAAKSLERIPLSEAADRMTVWMPASEKGLLIKELAHAFAKAGLNVEILPENPAPAALLDRLREHRPSLFFCVNFQGLDPYGQNAAALHQLNVPVAIWCVDNPFHLLPALKSTFWQRCTLFVTDDWFLRPLQEHGAQHVFHLPLAADPEHFQPQGALLDASLAEKIVFVGRSSFPDKDSFFAGCALPRELMTQANAMMDQSRRPDFAWWWEHSGQVPLWPGKAVRQIGFASEQCSQKWRVAHLSVAAQDGRLTVFGDQGWRPLLPKSVELRPEMDYYGPLPDIYRQARYTLNLTSLLLPHGLTQRHFDVWTVGGFLLTDNTPGLNIFDQELVHETAFAKTEDLLGCIRRLEREQNLAEQLRTGWRKHILNKHTYDQRMATVLNAVANMR